MARVVDVGELTFERVRHNRGGASVVGDRVRNSQPIDVRREIGKSCVIDSLLREKPFGHSNGVNIRLLNALLFGLGAVLAGVAGLLAGPVMSVQVGMGEPILILTMVVIVIGGIGSIRGAFYASLIVGVVDTLGRTLLPALLRGLMERSSADIAGPAIASMMIYILMAVVLALRPQGLFPVQRG